MTHEDFDHAGPHVIQRDHDLCQCIECVMRREPRCQWCGGTGCDAKLCLAEGPQCRPGCRCEHCGTYEINPRADCGWCEGCDRPLPACLETPCARQVARENGITQ